MGRVPQHDGQKLPRQAGAVDVAGEALLHQQGNAAGVVDVGVGDQAVIDLAGGEVQGVVVVLVPALLQAAVDEDLPAVDFQTVAAPRDSVGRAEETQLHTSVLLFICRFFNFIVHLFCRKFQYNLSPPSNQPKWASAWTTPSSSAVPVTQSTCRFISSWALPMATPMPAWSSMDRSFSPSPKAIASSTGMRK